MSGKLINWFACPEVSPKGEYMCCKPYSHSGKCKAVFSNDWVLYWTPVEKTDIVVSPLKISPEEITKYGIKVKTKFVKMA